ncbi:YopX family protein [Paenibacillus sp. FSL P4-0176]|uniref:YopX family protein n=1 Tax=Paenibacillus sp. FSL P4-0176 TaxID=2921631 RepID=UPI0030CB1875
MNIKAPRAWYKPLGVMIQPESVESINFETKVIGVYMVMDGRGFHRLRLSDFELMWPVGIKDSNGKDVYESDIKRINFDTNYIDNPYYIGVVEYVANRGYPAFDLEPWVDCGMNALSWLKSESDPSVISYEVIGNIYENPELLAPKEGAEQ